MIEIDRKTAPEIKPIEINKITEPELVTLGNGIPTYLIKDGSQPVVKIDFIFQAGIWYQKNALIASTVSSMLIEGTKKLSSSEIAEKLDFYGAFLSQLSNNDNTIITLYTLSKFLPEIIKIVGQVIKGSIFPENELAINLNKRKQAFLVEQEMTRTLANQKLKHVLFGNEHPYSTIIRFEDYDQIKREDLTNFYNNYYSQFNCKIIAAGKLDNKFITILENNFGKDDWRKKHFQQGRDYQIITGKEKRYYIKKNNAVQSAISIGKILFNRIHPEFMEMKFVNILFGGYFGSRLMKNIREDKGYTYGISSQIQSFLHAGVFMINTEVKSEVTEKALKEIYLEMDKIQEELLSENELEKVRNYVLGDLLSMFDGPFAMSDSFRLVNDYNLNFKYYEEYVTKIKHITPRRIQELAQKYLDKNDMTEVVAGP